MHDRLGSKVRERVWVEKIDKTGDEPKLIETIMIENGRRVEAMSDGQETKQAAERTGETADIQGQGDQETRPRMNPWQALTVVMRAADEAGIPLENAVKFLSALHINVVSAASGARVPSTKQ